MEAWALISYLLCVYGFLREMRPADPYYMEFMVEPTGKNMTEQQVIRDFLPVGTYSYLLQLIVIFLVTDLMRYKPLILLTNLAGLIYYGMILWTTTVVALQVAQFFNGTYMTGEIAYFTYIYAKLEKVHFAKVAAHSRTAMLAGKFFACCMAQAAVALTMLTYKSLNRITFYGQICAITWALRLPRARKSLYFHRHQSVISMDISQAPLPVPKYDEAVADQISNFSAHEFEQVSTMQLLWIHVKEAYLDKQVLLWSIFYSAATCGYLQVYTYIQVLWNELNPDDDAPWNAGADAVFRLFGALACLAAGKVCSAYYEQQTLLTTAGILTLIQGLTVLVSCNANSIVAAYVSFVIFGILHCFLITLSSIEVARHLQGESFALIFGINTFFALLMQTSITLANNGFTLAVINQYKVSGCYYIVIGSVYIIFEVIECILTTFRRR